MKSWQPPLILIVVLGVAVTGFALGGPGMGISLAGLSLVGLVVVVLRSVPSESVGRAPHPESARRILIASTVPIEDGRTVSLVADEIRLGGATDEAEIRILTPANPGFLDRWATDLRKARERAQRDLVISVATLALSGLEAEAHVGDEDIARAIADELTDFDATEVYLVTAERGPAIERLEERLRSNLAPRFQMIEVNPRDQKMGLD